MTHRQELYEKICDGLDRFVHHINDEQTRAEIKHMIMEYTMIYGMELRFDIVTDPADPSYIHIQPLDEFTKVFFYGETNG
jgi:hypothetical protein